MNERFHELPVDKQERIINAGFEVFGKFEYKDASTEDIAYKSGISKGLLFYYFHNKKSLYLYLLDYAERIIKKNVIDTKFDSLTDFFELFEHASHKKFELLHKNPHILNFVMKAFYHQNDSVSEAMKQRLVEGIQGLYASYFSRVDYSKFREDIDPKEILQMLAWIGEGYLYERQKLEQPLDLNDIVKKYSGWSSMLKRISYKEEYLK